MALTHKHHIIPKHMGGTDLPENIIELTVADHQQAHWDLYQQYGKTEDLCAFYMLSGNIEEFRKAWGKLGKERQMQTANELGCSVFDLICPEGQHTIRETARAMGKKYGPALAQRNKESGWMSELGKSMDPETRRQQGIKGGNTNKQNKTGAFCDPVLHQISASKGGKAQGAINAATGHMARIALLPRNRTKNMWITDGTSTKKINKDEQIPDGWSRGRTTKSTTQ